MEDRYLSKAKRLDDGEWIIGNRIDDGVTGQVFIHAVGNSVNESDKVGEERCLQFVAFEVDPTTICQCTGKDKNGNLIWENDIVEIGEHEDTVNGLYKVIYCENAHCYALKRSVDFHYNFFTFSDLNGFETSSKVIGNIFDNPELLESEG